MTTHGCRGCAYIIDITSYCWMGRARQSLTQFDTIRCRPILMGLHYSRQLVENRALGRRQGIDGQEAFGGMVMVLESYPRVRPGVAVLRGLLFSTAMLGAEAAVAAEAERPQVEEIVVTALKRETL